MESNEQQRESLQGRTIAFFGEFAYWPGYHCCSPVELAKRLGATLWDSVDIGLDFLVIGDKRGKGRAQALRKAELVQRATTTSGRKLQVLSEAAYRELVRIDLTGKSFYFAGGFDCCPKEMGDDLLGGMVTAVGGAVAPAVHTLLDYLVLGNRRGKGKTEAERKGLEFVQAGWGLSILDEAGFLELIRRDTPIEPTAGAILLHRWWVASMDSSMRKKCSGPSRCCRRRVSSCIHRSGTTICVGLSKVRLKSIRCTHPGSMPADNMAAIRRI